MTDQEPDVYPATIEWRHLKPVFETEPLLLRNEAGLRERLEQGPMTLVELLRWQRQHYAMAT